MKNFGRQQSGDTKINSTKLVTCILGICQNLEEQHKKEFKQLDNY